MCATCGCGDVEHEPAPPEAAPGHMPSHGHDHQHEHGHDHEHGRTIRLERQVLERNDRIAERNRGWFDARGICALNLVSSPGAGKTTLLERSLRDLGSELRLHVIEGDQETSADADRIRAAGGRAVQINTGTGCHLDAAMVARALPELDAPPGSTLFIENVGNLVCPALFDLGERAKVLIASVADGEDKPLKYPHMFRAAAVLVLNKIDLLPHLNFDAERFLSNARQVNSRLRVFRVSAASGEGLPAWYAWLREQQRERAVA